MASATLELLEFIRSQNLKPLVQPAKNYGIGFSKNDTN